jgi:putative CocE/NonD family hydrolase
MPRLTTRTARRWIAWGTSALLSCATALAADAPKATHHTEWATMRDGVLLPTEVYLPAGMPGPLPVVMLRSPYNGPDNNGCINRCEELAARGYVVLNQDVRGTGRAQGRLTPFFQERNDGYDAVEWAARQPWSNGKVGLWGVSYYGVTVMQAAAMHPPHLVAAVAIITAADYHDNWTYVNGVFDQWFAQSWLGGWARIDAWRREQLRSGMLLPEVRERGNQMGAATSGLQPGWTQHLPLDEMPDFRGSAPFYFDWLTHPDYSPWWSPVDIERQYQDIKVPMLFVGGWYDIFSVGTVRNFRGLRARGGSELARNGSRLVMYPLCHGVCNDAIRFKPDFWSNDNAPLSQEWFDRWLRGKPDPDAQEPVVKLWLMVPPEAGNQDSGRWITAGAYPLPGTDRQHWSLRSQGQANTRNGDGELVAGATMASAGPADHYAFDPAHPVPTLGGNLCCNEALQPPGAFDQATLELRDDVLVYTSAPLAADLTVVGPVNLHFWAASSAPDTDFTAKLVDVRADGVAFNLLDRVVNAGLRRGSKLARSPIRPGVPYEYDLFLGDTAVVFRAGHRVRIEVSSSNFPHYARNPNTGGRAGQATRFVVARQTVLHDAKHGSWLELPVVTLKP